MYSFGVQWEISKLLNNWSESVMDISNPHKKNVHLCLQDYIQLRAALHLNTHWEHNDELKSQSSLPFSACFLPCPVQLILDCKDLLSWFVFFATQTLTTALF